MIAFRFLQLAIASAFLLGLLKGDQVDSLKELWEDFEVELCDLPCANNGRCIAFDSDGDGVLDPQCFCNTTFQGDLCEIPRPSPCTLACENGGTCSLGDVWWLLQRKDDGIELEFFKDILFRCTTEDRDCKSFLNMRCECPRETRGQLCETKCEKTCLNGAECTFWGSEQRCSCTEKFYGDQCENECTKSCQNGGICIPSSNGSGGLEELCLCPAGFEGELCETARPCEVTCQNEGVCKFHDNQFFREEEFDYPSLQAIILERCTVWDVPISECVGVFEEKPGAYCECPTGTMGRFCEFNCDLDCQNGSTCQFYSRQNTYCPCEGGFAGDLCQFQCSKNCGNRGVCTSDGTNESCQCSPYYEGDLCETEKTCDLTCLNGGNCVINDRYRKYNEKHFQECLLNDFVDCPGIEDIMQCSCTSDFIGRDCGTPCPCQNGGRCSSKYWYRNRKLQGHFVGENTNEEEPYSDDAVFPEEQGGGYFCQCPFGYYGRDCEFKYDSEDCELDCQNGGYCQADLGWQDDVGEGDWDGPEDELEHDKVEHKHEHDHNQNQNSYNYNGRGLQSNSNNKNNAEAPHNNDDFDNNIGIGAPSPAPQRPFEYCVCPDGFRGVSCEIKIDPCNNRCTNGGVCTTADSVSTQGGNRALQSSGATTGEDPAASFPRPEPIPVSAGFCSCPEGYSGDFCELKACGSGHCSHGGTCIELPSGQTTSAGDDYVCDCSTSTLEATVGIGRNCDAIVYDICPWVNSKKNPNEPWTCAGYGRCYNEEGSTTPKCYCGDRVSTGPRCEFNSTDPKDVAWSECSLQCSNDGICLKGATKPVAEIFIPFMEGTKKSGLFDYQTPDFEYCYCPDGFFGVQCDMQYDICGNKDHICFHGSTCTNKGGEWGCDCTGTESAGLYCQYKATDDCGDNDVETFCTNGSTCTLDSNSNAFCTCEEGWEGMKCETEIKLAAPAGGGDNNWSSASVAGSLVSILSVAVVSLVLLIA